MFSSEPSKYKLSILVNPLGQPPFQNIYVKEPFNAPFLNGLFSSGFSGGKTAPWDEIGETPHQGLKTAH